VAPLGADGAQRWITFQAHVLADELAKTTNDAGVNALNDELELLRDEKGFKTVMIDDKSRHHGVNPTLAR
jgi:hypothetical protein